MKPSKEKIIHRLVYQSFKTLAKPDGIKLGDGVTLPELQSITFEVLLSRPSEAKSTAEAEEGSELDDLVDDDFEPRSGSRRMPHTSITLSPVCRVEHERILDLMMPDRYVTQLPVVLSLTIE